MNIFDILIGNQDRHPYNWQILFKGNKIFFGPLYDNGASLGWQLQDHDMEIMVNDEQKLYKYLKNMKVKAGLIEKTQPKMKALQVLSYCLENYPEEMETIKKGLQKFNTQKYDEYVDHFPLISGIRKVFLKKYISFRKNQLLSIMEGEG